MHLYDDPARILGHVEDVRSLMRKSGSEKPVVVGEYAGPSLFEFPDALAALERGQQACPRGGLEFRGHDTSSHMLVRVADAMAR